MPDDPTVWRNVKPRPYSTEPEDVFATLAEHVHTLYNMLNSREERLRITLQDAHWATLNEVLQGDTESILFLRICA